MTQPALSTPDVATIDRPVRIDVLVVRRDKAEAAVKLTGPVRSTVRQAFAHPKLATALQTLQMDSDRLVGRIVSRWEKPGNENEDHQLWVKSNGSTTVRWWVNRDDGLPA